MGKIHNIWEQAILELDVNDHCLQMMADHLFVFANEFADAMTEDHKACFSKQAAQKLLEVRMMTTDSDNFYLPKDNNVNLRVSIAHLTGNLGMQQRIELEFKRTLELIDPNLWRTLRKHNLVTSFEDRLNTILASFREPAVTDATDSVLGRRDPSCTWPLVAPVCTCLIHIQQMTSTHRRMR